MLAQPAAGLNTFFRGEVEENGLNSNDKLKKLAVDSNATCNKTLDSTEMEINSGNETFQDEASAGDIKTQETESSFEACVNQQPLSNKEIAETDQGTDEINDNPLVSPIDNKSLAVTPNESSPILERNEAAPQEAKDANQSTTKGKL